jgi:hypothetical protein
MAFGCIWKHASTARYSKLFQDFDPDVFVQHKAVILVAATYGEGDPTDNAAEFYKWIHDDSHEPECLKGMHYTVMGLGNRQEVTQNHAGLCLECMLCMLYHFFKLTPHEFPEKLQGFYKLQLQHAATAGSM